MKRPILVLQYPDPHEGRTIAIAVTRSPKALQAFKEAVLEETKLATIDWGADELIDAQNQMELQRLERLFKLLIPDTPEAENA